MASSSLFPSGDWIGFYNYGRSPQRHLMDVRFHFAAGRISAAGADGVGEFVLEGAYDESSRECSWVKRYLGAHAVAYGGFREGKGIWGTWELEGQQGGFHVWPLGLGGETTSRREAEPRAVAAEEKTVGIVPASNGHGGGGGRAPRSAAAWAGLTSRRR